ncbi:hypothetical protein CBL_04260 [Carabus blaptoides fortunei]
MKSLFVLCTLLLSALAAEDSKKEATQEAKKQDKRGLFGLGHGDFGGASLDLGGGDGGHHHHEHVKTVVVEKKIPVPYTVTKHVPYSVEKKKVPYEVKVPVPRPYEVKVPVPQPYSVEKKVPYPVKEVHVPVVKQVPYPVKVPVHVPVHVHSHGQEGHGGYH